MFDCALATYEEERSSAARPGRTVSSYFIFAEFLAVGDVPQYDLLPYGTEQNGSLLKTGKHENRNFDCLAGITYRLVMSSLEQEHNALACWPSSQVLLSVSHMKGCRVPNHNVSPDPKFAEVARRSSLGEAHVQTEPSAQLFLSRNAHFGKHRL